MSRRTAVLAAGVVACAAMLAAVVFLGESSEPTPPPAVASDATAGGATQAEPPAPPETAGYEAVLAALDDRIARLRRRAAERNDWADLEALAATHLSRARLTGDYEEYARAGEALDRAFAMAGEGSGPRLLRAQHNFAVHRLEPVEDDLAAVEGSLAVGPAELAELHGLRGDVALHQGRYDDARRSYHESLRVRRTPTGLFRLGQYHLHTGDFHAAEALLASAERAYLGRDTQTKAWFALQRGLLELTRGRWDAALERYREADAHLPGWWLVEEHIAEILVLQGERDRARQTYREVVERTGNPELMDALAELVDEPERSTLVQRARAEWDARLERHPEASIDHALEHFLSHGQNERALELAERNVALRPSGESRILLAQAYLANDRLADARRQVEAVLATPYRSPDLHVTAAQVYERAGDATRAAAERARAVALNPHALD